MCVCMCVWMRCAWIEVCDKQYDVEVRLYTAKEGEVVVIAKKYLASKLPKKITGKDVIQRKRRSRN